MTLGIDAINVRFFCYGRDDDGELDILEVAEYVFRDLGGNITYEMNTVFDHGCRQICLTTDAEHDTT
tara:strand:- start:9 stop:209 length:201 start_codon:yes stop_codon:yes gene_type:complete